MDKNHVKTYPLSDLGLTLIYTSSAHVNMPIIVGIQNSRIWAKNPCISFLSQHYIVT